MIRYNNFCNDAESTFSVVIQQAWLDESGLQTKICIAIGRPVSLQEGCIWPPSISHILLKI